MRAPIRQTLRTRNGVRSVIIERRAIPAVAKAPKPEPVEIPILSTNENLFPLAADVARVLAGWPVRFPDVWWR